MRPASHEPWFLSPVQNVAKPCRAERMLLVTVCTGLRAYRDTYQQKIGRHSWEWHLYPTVRYDRQHFHFPRETGAIPTRISIFCSHRPTRAAGPPRSRPCSKSQAPERPFLGGTAGSIFHTRHLVTTCQGCQVQVGMLGRLTACLTAPSSNQAPAAGCWLPAAAAKNGSGATSGGQ